MTRDPKNLKLFIKGNHFIAMDPRSKMNLLPVNNTFAKLGKSAKVILPDNNLLLDQVWNIAKKLFAYISSLGFGGQVLSFSVWARD